MVKGQQSLTPGPEMVAVSNRTGSHVHKTTNRGLRGQTTSSDVREMRSAEPGDQTTMTQFFDYMEMNDGITLDHSGSCSANVSSEERNASKKMSEKSTSGKASGGSKGKTSGGSKGKTSGRSEGKISGGLEGKTSGGSRGKRRLSKGASILRVRKAVDNVMDSKWGDEEDLSLLHSSKGKDSKVSEASDTQRISNRGEKVSLVHEKRSDTDLPSDSKKGRRSTMATETTTSHTRYSICTH